MDQCNMRCGVSENEFGIKLTWKWKNEEAVSFNPWKLFFGVN